MAQQETIKEFVAALGFKIDESQWSRFEQGLTSATLKARLLGDAMEAMARTIVEKVVQAADQFEQLFYQTQRIGAAAGSIRAFAYAVSQMGGTVAGANASLQAFGDFMRSTPGAERLIQGLGVATRDAHGHMIDRARLLLDIGKRLGDMSKQGPAGVGLANAWADRLGIDPATLLAIERPEVRARYRQGLASAGSAGIGDDLTAQAAKFEKAFRETWQRVVDFAEGAEGKLMTALIGPLEKLNTFLDDHKERINSALSDLASSLATLAEKGAAALSNVNWEQSAKDLLDAAHGVAEFVRSLAGFIKSMEDLNERSKTWWITKYLNWSSGGNTGGMTPGGLYDPFSDPSNPASKNPDGSTGGWGTIKDWWGRARGWFGGGSSSGAGTPVAPPGPPGTYRPQYRLSAKDISDAVVDTIAGEASTKNPAAIDAVINNMFNRLGSKGYGPSGNLEEVARAPGQYTGWRVPSSAEADMIRARIRAIASGGVPDNTHGSMEYRGAWLYYPFRFRHPEGVGVGGNWFFPTGVHEGPYAAYGAPHFAAKPSDGSAHAATLDWTAAPGWGAINAALPVGAAGAPSSVKTDNRQANVTNTVHVVAPDPHTAAAMVGAHLDRTSADVQRNLQGAAQ